jgi:hypothetical protein
VGARTGFDGPCTPQFGRFLGLLSTFPLPAAEGETQQAAGGEGETGGLGDDVAALAVVVEQGDLQGRQGPQPQADLVDQAVEIALLEAPDVRDAPRERRGPAVGEGAAELGPFTLELAVEVEFTIPPDLELEE